MVEVVSTRFDTISWKANSITRFIWTNGYQWAKSNKSIISIKLDSELIQYYIPAGDETHISNNEIDVIKKLKWYSFDQYKVKAFNIWCATLPVNKLKWLDGLYNCPAFFKKILCKHVVGIAIRLNYCKPLPAGKNIKIGEKRRRHRPSKAKAFDSINFVTCKCNVSTEISEEKSGQK
jgi:hypothetical protein